MLHPLRFAFLGLVALGASLASAAPKNHFLVCDGMSGDGGYAVTFSQNGRKATVQENNIAGAKVVAKLSCAKTKPAPCCDQITTTPCIDLNGGSGYVATLRTGGFAGIKQVKLERDDQEIDEIGCRWEPVQQ